MVLLPVTVSPMILSKNGKKVLSSNVINPHPPPYDAVIKLQFKCRQCKHQIHVLTLYGGGGGRAEIIVISGWKTGIIIATTILTRIVRECYFIFFYFLNQLKMSQKRNQPNWKRKNLRNLRESKLNLRAPKLPQLLLHPQWKVWQKTIDRRTSS